jgi:hypothetical protein
MISNRRPRASVAACRRRSASAEISYCGSERLSGPAQQHDPRRHKAHEVVDVPVGLVLPQAAPQPDQLFRAEVVADESLDLASRESRVPIAIEKALLGREHRALAIHVD